MRRDSRECWICGSTENLQAHHIVPWHIQPDNDDDNLVILCRKCHMTLHRHHDNPNTDDLAQIIARAIINKQVPEEPELDPNTLTEDERAIWVTG